MDHSGQSLGVLAHFDRTSPKSTFISSAFVVMNKRREAVDPR